MICLSRRHASLTSRPQLPAIAHCGGYVASKASSRFQIHPCTTTVRSAPYQARLRKAGSPSSLDFI